MYPDEYTTNSTAVIVFLCFLFCGATYGQIPHMDGIDERVVHVIQTQTSRQRGRRSADGFPPELRLDILRMTDVVLHRMYDVTDHVPILLKRGSRVEQFQPISKRIVAFYTNTTIEASFMTWHRQDSSELDVFGTFVDHEEEYLLQTDSTASTLARVPRLLAGQLDTVIVAPSTRDNIKGNNIAEQPSRNKRQTTQYEVEVMVVVDFAVYSFWFAKMNGTDLEKKAAAMETIRQYYAFILNGVNLRYSTVTRVSYTITALYAGIYIADTADAAPFDEPLKFTLSSLEREALNAESVLSAFKEWAVGSLSSYNYDHAMMFTAYDMGSNVSGTFSNSVSGLAYLSGVCRSNRYSINEDHFNTLVNTVAAHELGHNLGASHDGEDGNACQPGDNYVMTARPDSLATAGKVLNMWRFSNCSITYFTALIDDINTNNENCLSSRSASYNSSMTDQYSSDIAGQLYPPDTQCQYIVGDGSYLMTSIYGGDYSTICTNLYCYNPGTISSYYIHIAWEGTTCGNGKMCALGNCVLSANAPTGLNDACLFGDIPYDVPFLNMTCQEMINDPDQTSRCYHANNYCCASCEELKTRYANIPGCLYGNNVTGCELHSTSNCYSASFYETCCGTCESRRTGITGCNYGDRASGCNVTNCPLYDEPSRTSSCCKTCAPTTQSPTRTTHAPKTTQAPTRTQAPTTKTPAPPSTQAPTKTTQVPAKTTQAPTTITHAPTTKTQAQTTTQAPTTTSALTTKPVTRIITIVIVLRITLPLEINLTNTNSAGFLQIKQEVELELTKIYSKRSGFLKVTVRKLRRGSLEIDYDVEIENTQQASTNFVKTSVDLVSGQEPLTIQNEIVSPTLAIVSNITVTNATQSNADQLCSLFVASSGGCPALYSCAVVNGETVCVLDVKSDIPEMMIWVATGVSVFIIIVIVLVAVIISRCRRNRKRRKEGRSSRNTEEINSDRHSHDRKRSELTTNAPYGRHGPNSAGLPSRSMPYHSNLGFDGTELRVTLDHYPRLPGPGHKQIDRHSRDHKRSELTTNAPYGRHGPNSARLPSRSMPYHSNLGFDGTESRVTLDHYPRLPGPGHKQM